MIVQESDILLAALDRRLQVDPVLAVDRLAAVTRASPSDRQPAATGAAPAATASTSTSASLASRLPLGQVVAARVVEVPRPDHVVAEIGSLRIELAWPTTSGITPRPGRDIGLRVLAHAPMLLFQSVLDEPTAHDDTDPQTRWSSDAMRLQSQGASQEPGTRPVRFDIPILEVEVVPLQATPEDATVGEVGLWRTAAFVAGKPAFEEPARIALDDVIVARSTAFVEGVETPLIPRSSDDGSRIPTAFIPLVLQGPAWAGQAVELVVRREREDEQFDNPVLDHWCGEVTIDLPRLGRVAGHLALSMQGLRLRLEGDEESTVEAMTASASELARAMTAVDLRVAALSVGRPAPDASRPHPLSPGGPRDG